MEIWFLVKTCGEHHQIQHDIDRDRRHAGDHCAWGHLIGNGICEKHIMYLGECQYDQVDCDLNADKEEIARLICDSIHNEVEGRF